MAKKSKRQSNRKKNIQNARQRAAAKARVPVKIVETKEAVPASTPDNIIEITELPEDALAGEAIKQIAETTDSVVAEAAAATVADTQTLEGPAVEETAATRTAALETPAAEAPTARKGIPLWGRILIGVAAVLIIVVGVVVGYISHFLSRIARSTDEEYATEEVLVGETDDAEEAVLDTADSDDLTWEGQIIEPMQDEGIKNILLIGQDRREGDSKEELKRSDAMVIISLNQETGQIKVCSLMRDMYVQIPGYGGNKLNYSYEKGGMELLDQTIEQNLGVTIDNNVEVDFDGFVEAMSVVGNLDIYLSQAEIDFMEAHPTWADDSGADVTTWDLHEGLNSMTPSEYAVFCRLRMIGNNDFERTERQRRVLSAAFTKIMDGGMFSILSVADSIIPYVTTDMTNSEILSYVYTVVTKGMELTSQYRIPLDGTWTNQTINRAAVLVCDMETNTKALQEYLYGDEEGVAFTSEEQRAEEKASGTFTTDSYSSTTGSGSTSGSYSGTSSSSSYSTGTAATTQNTTDAGTVTEGTDTQTVDDAAVVTDPAMMDGTTVTTDPAAIDGAAVTTDPATVVTDPATDQTNTTDTTDQAAMDAAAAAQAAAQAAAAQALAEQAAAAQAAAAAAQAATTTP